MTSIEPCTRFDERFESKGFPGFFGNDQSWMAETICEVFSEEAKKIGVPLPLEVDVFGLFEVWERLTWINVATDLLDERPPQRKFISPWGHFYLGRVTLKG